jgi:hypothetical protein
MGRRCGSKAGPDVRAFRERTGHRSFIGHHDLDLLPDRLAGSADSCCCRLCLAVPNMSKLSDRVISSELRR